MTTARHAAPRPRSRHQRRVEQRRLRREEILAGLVLVVILLATVGLLALQWLDPGTTSNAAPLLSHPHPLSLPTLGGLT